MRDPIIEYLVRFAEDFDDARVDVTLLVQGTFVTGFIISKDKYFQLNPHTKFFLEKLAELEAAGKVEPAPVKDAEETANDLDRNWIHLENARFFQGGAFIPNEGTVCRIKIEDVSSLVIGTLAPAKDKPQ